MVYICDNDNMYDVHVVIEVLKIKNFFLKKCFSDEEIYLLMFKTITTINSLL